MYNRRIIFMSLVLLPCSVSLAQPVAVPQLDSLIVKLHDAIEVQRSIEIEEIKGVYKLTPWHFVPSLNYDLIGGRYYLTISSSAFVTNMIGKRQETRRLSAATRKYDNQTKAAEIRLKSLFVSINQNLVNLKLSHDIVSNDMEIYLIKSTEHANNEIDTETFLKEKSSILNKIRNHNTEVANIQRQLLEIELLTESEISLDLSAFLISPAAVVPLIPTAHEQGKAN